MGMGGVQRAAKFAKYLPSFGWEVEVLCAGTGSYYAFDYTLLDELNIEGINITRTGKFKEGKSIRPINENLRKFISKLAQVSMVPDTKRMWIKKAKKYAEEILKKNKIDLIFSTAPPYSGLLLGYNLSKEYNIPLIVDYRDAWVDGPYNFYPTPLHKAMNIKLEKKILLHSKKIITINDRIRELLIKRYGEKIRDKINIISQGYDPEDFVQSEIEVQDKREMKILYAGSFFHFMTPEYFFRGVNLAIEKKPELENKIILEFAGLFPNEYKPAYSDKYKIEYFGYLPHRECTKKMMEADILWMMLGEQKGSEMISTGKIYDYMGSGKPIIACVPESEAKKTLTEYGNVKICAPYSPEEISDAIIYYYDLYINANLPSGDKNFIKNFNRKKLTQELSELFFSSVNFPEKIL